MLPTCMVVLGAVLLRMSVDGQASSSSYSTSSSATGYAPVTYTHTSGNNALAAATAYHPGVVYQPQQRPLTRRQRDYSSSFSSSVPGYAPVTQTYTTGNAQATASTGTSQPVIYYYVPVASPAVTSSAVAARVPPRVRRDTIPFDLRHHRNDASQQVFQKDPPVALQPTSVSAFPFAPAPLSVQSVFPPAPHSFSAPAGISQSQSAGFENAFPREAKAAYQHFKLSSPATSQVISNAPFAAAALPTLHSAYGLPAEEAGSFAGADALAGAAAPPPPAPYAPPPPPPLPSAYGPPAEEAGEFAGAEALAGAAAPPPPPPAPYAPPPPRKPHIAYGVPVMPKYRVTPIDTSNFPDRFRELEFVPAFPDERPPKGVELSPPALGEFVPPDGALLSSPAAGPSPRNPLRRQYL